MDALTVTILKFILFLFWYFYVYIFVYDRGIQNFQFQILKHWLMLIRHMSYFDTLVIPKHHQLFRFVFLSLFLLLLLFCVFFICFHIVYITMATKTKQIPFRFTDFRLYNKLVCSLISFYELNV